MTGTDDNPSDEFGVFIGADGQRLTDSPWRLQALDQSGPLSASQISELADRFKFDAPLLVKLSERLGHVLDPSANIHVIPASGPKAKRSAKSDVAYARRELKATQFRLCEVVERVSFLTPEDYEDESPCSQHFAGLLIELQTSLESVTRALTTLEGLDGPNFALVRWEPLDRRKLYDRRRDEVLGAIFQFWVDAGRRITFTTDPSTSERHGELVSFTQAVCAYLTDPPTEIAAETIVKKIRGNGKSYQPIPDWGKSFPTPDELRDVLNGSKD